METTGRTMAEAKDAALDQLGVDENDAEFEILEEPRSGLFGRTRGEARVRARVRPTRPRPKEEHGRRRPRRDKTERAGSPAKDEEAGSETRASVSASGGDRGPGPVEAQPRRRRSSRSGPASGVATDAELSAPAAPSAVADVVADKAAAGAGEEPGEGRPGGGGRRKRRRGSSDGGDSDTENGQPAETGYDPVRTGDGGMVDEEPKSLEQHGEAAREFLSGLLERLDLPAKIGVQILDEDILEVAVTGEDLGLLIGPRGTTLAALQELTRTVVQRQAPGSRTPRIMVDVAGYRQKRRIALERFAKQLAEEVLASHEQRVLEPMQAADRKVVHDTINGIDGVRTVSEGEDAYRHVVILPD